MNSTPFERVVKRGQAFYILRPTAFQDSREIQTKTGRPGIIISRDEENFMSGTVMVAYTTGAKNIKFPRETQYTVNSGRLIHSVVKCEQIDTVDKACIGDYICDMTDEEMNAIDECIIKALNLTPSSESHDAEVESLSAKLAHHESMYTELHNAYEREHTIREEIEKEFNAYKNAANDGTDYKAEAEKYKRFYNDLLKTLAGKDI